MPYLKIKWEFYKSLLEYLVTIFSLFLIIFKCNLVLMEIFCNITFSSFKMEEPNFFSLFQIMYCKKKKREETLLHLFCFMNLVFQISLDK